ncbi:MAG TPA: hypothetical protein PKA63_13575 [Oligoflexia bacterium]|nr:hypothetical protein [Oligoflexia bacterium]HMP49692.1 hypothetical protein [Oligoflexia bacterium]
MSLKLESCISRERAIFLKEKSKLLGEQKTLGRLESEIGTLRRKKEKYINASDGLLKSALSVTPDKGIFSSANLLDRSRWAEKAFSLRKFSLNEASSVSRELFSKELLKQQAEIKVGTLKEKTIELELKIKRSYFQRQLAVEEKDLSELNNLRMYIDSQHARNS